MFAPGCELKEQRNTHHKKDIMWLGGGFVYACVYISASDHMSDVVSLCN